MSNVTVISVKSGIGNPSSNSGLVYSIHFHTKTIGKCMNPSVLPLPMGSGWTRIFSFKYQLVFVKEISEFKTMDKVMRNHCTKFPKKS